VTDGLPPDETELFARELDEAYETMSLLHRLGSRMHDFREPATFVKAAVSGVRELLGFAWVGVILGEHPKLLYDMSGRPIMSSLDGETEALAAKALAPRVDSIASAARRGITGVDEPTLGPEVVTAHVSVRDQVVGYLTAGGARLDPSIGREEASSADTRAIDTVAKLVGSVLESRRLFEEQTATFLGSLKALAATLDAKDRYTHGHSERVALLGWQLAKALRLDAEEAERVHLSGKLHDIGKIGVPDRVLRKPGKLTDEEFEQIKKHPRIGYDILSSIPAVDDVLPGVLHHHEKWNGRGYPDGLAGEDIALQARILGLADTFDAMSSNRAYRSARPREEVLAEIRRCAGTQFDPELVEPFVTMDFESFDEMKARHEAEDVGTQELDEAA